MIGTLGAGDIKLLFVLLIGNRNPLYFLLSVFVLGLIIGVLNNVRRGTFLNRIRIIKEKIRSALLTGNPSELVSYLNAPEHKKEKGVIVHLSLPILITETLRIIIDLFKGV
jgi:Flp pilus assembly protein protease CpaA